MKRIYILIDPDGKMTTTLLEYKAFKALKKGWKIVPTLNRESIISYTG